MAVAEQARMDVEGAEDNPICEVVDDPEYPGEHRVRTCGQSLIDQLREATRLDRDPMGMLWDVVSR